MRYPFLLLWILLAGFTASCDDTANERPADAADDTDAAPGNETDPDNGTDIGSSNGTDPFAPIPPPTPVEVDGRQLGFVTADNPALRYFGRIDRADPAAPTFDWSAIYIRMQFTGSVVGVQISGNDVFFDVYVNGVRLSAPAGTVALGDASLHVNGNQSNHIFADDLGPGPHELKVSKRSETHWSAVTFHGVYVDSDATISAPDTRHGPRIEVIGDSYSAGMGNISPSKTNPAVQDDSGRECTAPEIAAYTDTHRAFGPIAAETLNGEYMINAYSGLGMVRNYNGNTAYGTLPEYYTDTLISSTSSPAWDFSRWSPDVVVILLGTNDLSTALNSGERFADRDALKTEFKTTYREFLTQIRSHYPGVHIVCAATNLWPDDELIPLVQEIIAEEQSAGATDLSYFLFYNVTGYGCQWHPDIATHQSHGEQLAAHISGILN